MLTDNGPDYRCPKYGKDILGEIEHKCNEKEDWEYGVWPYNDEEKFLCDYEED